MSLASHEQEKLDKKYMKVAAGFIITLWGSSWLLLYLSTDVRGTLGDMFGAVNALFSGFAFLGVIYAILLQKTELRLQREELAMTRAELKKSANAQEKSEKALKLQAEAMAKTASINSLSSSLESLESRIGRISLSGESRAVAVRRAEKERLEKKVKQIVDKLDSLVEESLVE